MGRVNAGILAISYLPVRRLGRRGPIIDGSAAEGRVHA